MQHVDDEILKALFEQSRLSLDPQTEVQWKKELEHWVNFFCIEDFPCSPSSCLRSPINIVMREDVVAKGLDSAQVRGLGSRLVDGFFALPKGTLKGTDSGN